MWKLYLKIGLPVLAVLSLVGAFYKISGDIRNDERGKCISDLRLAEQRYNDRVRTEINEINERYSDEIKKILRSTDSGDGVGRISSDVIDRLRIGRENSDEAGR